MAKPVNEMTPMQRQYHAIKEQNQDCILFFRLGDFYEMFDDDACVAAKELDLTLTTRDRSKPPCAVSPTTPWMPISPGWCKRVTRWPSASR